MRNGILAGLSATLLAASAFADHNAVQLDRLLLSLPAGWQMQLVRNEGFSRYGVPELFAARLELPSVQYELDVMGTKRTVHPSLLLCFYAPLTEKQYADFQKKVDAEVTAIGQPPPATLLLAKTENYWVFTCQYPDHFNQPKVEEVYRHVKAFLSINRKE